LDTLLGFHATTSLCRWAPLAGAKVRALHHHSLRKTPANSTVAIQNPGELQDAIERDFEVLRAIGVHPTNKRTSLFVSDAELEAVRTSVQKANPAGLPIVAFLPGARIETKRYPKDLWIQVLESVPRERMQPIIVVDPALSREWDLPSIAARLRTPIWDRLTLREMMAVLKLCDFAVGNDSGPTHIAAALGLKTLRFFGPACFADWHPYALEEHPALRVDIECRNLGPKDRPLFRYCTLDHCDHLSCLRKISPASATAKLQGLVDRVDADLKN
jgi:ADP-heptose:LPS heptosyltransferase